MTPLVLTVAIAGTLLFTQSTTNHAAKTQGHDRQTADLVLHGDGLGVPEATAEQARQTPGVAAVVGISSTNIVALDDLGSPVVPLPAQMIDGEGTSQVLRPRCPLGSPGSAPRRNGRARCRARTHRAHPRG